jgi:hypothetical protein
MTPPPHRRTRTDRGVAFPSPVVVLSIIAVVMAGVSYVATRGSTPAEQEIAAVSRPETSSSTSAPEVESSTVIEKKKQKKKKKPVDRSSVYVVVFNNSGITGLAGQYAGSATNLGWQVVGSDNWYGTIPTSTVYYPAQLEREANQLSLDLGIGRVAPAVDPMSRDRLTVILTADAA